MEKIDNIGTDEQRMQRLLDAFLLSRKTLKSSAAETSFHLDDDSLAAFTEGKLSERESLSFIRHLVDCGFCLHKTAELVKLDLEFEGAMSDHAIVPSAEPSRISEVLSNLFARIFGSSDQAVFAHNEEEKDEEKAEDDESDEEKK